MDSQTRLTKLLSNDRARIVNSINSLIGSHLRKSLNAEEVLGEVLVYLLQRTEIWEKRSDKDLAAFLLWKAKLLIIDRARTLRVDTKVMEELAKLELGKNLESRNVEPSPSYHLHRKAKRSAMEQYLNLLDNENYKTALKLVRLEGRSIDEAAAIMGKNPRTVEKLVERGFAKLIRTVRAAGGWKYATSGETT